MPKAWGGPLVAVVLGMLGACGGGEAAVRGPTAAPTASPTPPASAPSSTSVPTAPKVAATPSASASAPAAPSPMKVPEPSSMDAKLREIGLDPMALPPLNKLDPKSLRDVMNTFTRSLGVGCGHCHEKDFKASTENKAIATYMWNKFVRGLAVEGGTLYCDSCHGGRAKFLERHDRDALAKWMDEGFVVRLKRTDTNEHGCGTCHGNPFVGPILRSAWGK